MSKHVSGGQFRKTQLPPLTLIFSMSTYRYWRWPIRQYLMKLAVIGSPPNIMRRHTFISLCITLLDENLVLI